MMKQKLMVIARRVIYICSGGILAYLLLVNILSTCVYGAEANGNSHVFYLKDYPIVHLASVVVLLGVIYWLNHKKLPEKDYRNAARLVIAAWGALAMVWVLLYMKPPRYDPENVLIGARQMRQYNFTSFVRGGYLNSWSSNQSLALFFYLLSFLFGIDNYIALRLLNVVSVMAIFFIVWKMVGELWGKGKRAAFYSVICSACFLPMILYTTFIYGDIYGLCLSVAAIYFQLKYFYDRKYRWMLLSVLCISLAVQLKMNYLIMAIAMAGLIVYDLFLHRYWKKAIMYMAVFIIGIAGVREGTDALLENIVGMEKAEGVPKEAWIAMGLQDGTRAAGNYNGYNLKVYTENEYDTSLAREESIESIKKSIREFKNNPGYAVNFFAKKIASQWNNPDSMILSNATVKWDGLSWLVNSVEAGGLRSVLRFFSDIFQVWILLGILCYILWEKNKSDYEWIFLLVFLGGFVFHLFWEAGSRYAFPYYFLMIPYSCIGLFLLEQKLEKAVKGRAEGKIPVHKYRLAGIGLLIVFVVILPYSGIFDKVVIVLEEEEKRQPPGIENGYYSISPAGDSELYLTEAGEDVILMHGDDSVQIVSLYKLYENQVIRFMPSQNTLELAGGEEVYPANLEGSFEWRLEPAGDNKYYILVDDKTALSYSLEDWSVRLKKFQKGDTMQIWTVDRKGGWNIGR